MRLSQRCDEILHLIDGVLAPHDFNLTCDCPECFECGHELHQQYESEVPLADRITATFERWLRYTSDESFQGTFRDWIALTRLSA